MSVSRGYAQIATGSKFLYSPANTGHGGFTPFALAADLVSNASLVISATDSMINTTNAASFLNGMNGDAIYFNQGDAFRDMGKQLHLLEKGVKIATFRLAQKVEDPSASIHNEGVGTFPTVYTCVWQAAGVYCPNAFSMVKVVRTG